MHKPTIDQLLTGEVEWKILDKMIHNWQGLSRETLQASIDALWYKCTPSTPVKKYTCRICKYETLLQKGVEQYTGLKDKNGKEIYEGDIIQTKFLRCSIKFRNGCFYPFNSGLTSREMLAEIIGNIHENGDLLK